MPPLPLVPGVVRVNLSTAQSEGPTGGNRFFFSYTGGAPSNATCAALATTVRESWGTNLKSLVFDGYELSEVEVTDLSSDTPGQGIDSTTIEGTRTGSEIPGNACALVNHQIQRKYRGGKPRTYLLAGVSADLGSPGNWGPTFTGDVLTGWEAFVAAILSFSGSIEMQNIVNVSYYNGFTAVENPITKRYRNVPNVRTSPIVDPITSSTILTRVASQRRRLKLAGG